MRKTALAIVAGAALAFGAPTAQAQVPLVPKMYSFGIHGGLTLPMGDLKDGFQSGYAVGGMLQIKPPLVPLGFRADVTYNRFDADGGVDTKLNILSGNASVVYNVIPTPLITPYVLGGVGLHRVGLSGTSLATESENKFGFHGGVGLNVGLAGFGTYIEARYVSVQTEGASTSFVPVTVGIKF